MDSWRDKPPHGPIGQAFLELWERSPEPPDAIAFLKGCPAATAQDWGDVFLVDQFHRWRLGQPRLVEDYLAARPELADDTLVVGWLIAEEFGYRKERGEAIDADAFLERFCKLFPSGWDALRRVLASSEFCSASRGSGGDETRSIEAPQRRDASTVADVEKSRSDGDAMPVIPGYRVEAPLGRGAFGVVYLAFDLTLERRVAIKVPHRRLAATEEQAQAYLAEARRLAQLDHPGIVPVYHAGRTEDGRCFMASKFIEGIDLKRVLAQGRPPWPEAARIAAAVAEALHHAHLRGIVHRDIKPANIILQPSGEPCVVDFGLSLHEDEQRRRRGEVSGTPAYMAPEQVRGETHLLDGRTDLWALGVVLYQLLTGRLPFGGRTIDEVMEEIERRDPKPCRMIDDRVPRELEQICLRCLEKPMARRYATARDLADDLHAAIARLDPPGVPPMAPRSDQHVAGKPISESVQSLERACDENVQFTVFRPKSVQPARWYPLLAFAHLSELPDDAPPGEPDPVEEVRRQAARLLGEQADDYADVRQDSGEPIPREGELTFVPTAPGVEFNPPQRSFIWREAVHREEFRLRAAAALEGQRVRGRMSVFLGSILIAEVPLVFRVEAAAPIDAQAAQSEAVAARRFRRIYPAFAEDDRLIVHHFETYARALGDEYLTQCQELRSQGRLGKDLRELIRNADVFQLFWSSHAMHSRLVRDECDFALSLGRKNWIRPVYWETPLPEDPARGLPPAELRRFEFQQLPAPQQATPPGLLDTAASEAEPDRCVMVAAPAPPPAWRNTAQAPPLRNRSSWIARLAGLFSRKASEPSTTSEAPPPAGGAARSEGEPRPELEGILEKALAVSDADRERLLNGALSAKLQRVRSPRVSISVPLNPRGEDAYRGCMVVPEFVEFPFVIAVLGDFSGGSRQPLSERRLWEVDRDSLISVFAALRPGASWEDFAGPNSTWGGLQYLLTQAETGELLRVCILDVRKEDSLADLRAAASPEETQLYEKLYVAGHANRSPPGLLLVDFAFSPEPEDRELLQALARLAEAICCPLAGGLAPAWFGAEHWSQVTPFDDALAHFLEHHQDAWRSLRRNPSFQFIALGLPSVVGELMETETDQFRGMNPAWILGAIAADAFARRGWFREMTVAEGGGLAPHAAPAQSGGIGDAAPPPRDDIPVEREKLLHDQGLFYVRRMETGAPGGQRVLFRAPVVHGSDDPEKGRPYSLSQLLGAGRVMQHLRLLAVHQLQAGIDAAEVQAELNRWVQGFVADAAACDDPASRAALRARFPLTGAEVALEAPSRRLDARLGVPSPDGARQSFAASIVLPPAP